MMECAITFQRLMWMLYHELSAAGANDAAGQSDGSAAPTHPKKNTLT
jgi:hypothetical protein